LLRVVALFDAKVALVVDNLGEVTQLSNKQIKEVLNWQPRSAEEAVIAMAQSFIDLNAV
jgi:dihydroflavonol-4-reductase